MSVNGRISFGFIALAAALLPLAASAQDLADTQVLTNRVLFAKEDAAAAQQAAERQRIAALDARANQQAVLLQEQAQSVQRLGGEIEALKDERQLTALADAFDAALAGARWAGARALLASEVTVDLGRTPAATQSADALIADLTRSLARGGVLPRSNQRVSFDADRAVVTADGYAWGRPSRSREVLDQQFGRYEYQFARTAEGWKITGLAFHPALPS